MKNIVVKQNDLRDCGACCLQAIIKFYDGFIPLEKIRLDTKTTKHGTTAFNLIYAARKYGFNAYGKKVNVLEQNSIYPAIAHVILKSGVTHFVVILKVDKKYVYLMDPSIGYRKMTIFEFEKIWTKVILIFKPYQELPKYPQKNIIYEIIKMILETEKLFLSKILFISFFVTFLAIFLSYHFKIAISLMEKSSLNITIFGSLLFLILTFIKIYCEYKRNELEIYLNKNINIKVIVPFIEHVLKLPLNVIKSRTSGEIMTRIYELNNVKDLFSEIFVTIVLDCGLSIVALVILYSINKKLFFILCITFILYIVIALVVNPFICEKVNDNIDKETEFNSLLLESVSNIESIKNLNATKNFFNKVIDKYATFLKSNFFYNLFYNKYLSLENGLKEIGLLIVSIVGIVLIQTNVMTLLDLITFNSILIYLADPIENCINLLPKINLIKLSIIKVNEFLVVEQEKMGKIQHFNNGKIVVKNLTYSYDDYHKLLQNFNIEIAEKERVLIKGKSGCGKSTFCQILNKTITNYKGLITIDDIDIKDYSLITVRKNIRYISQEESLFTDTIMNNITLGKDISMQKINTVLKLTKVDEILSKKQMSLDTLLFDGGSNLSGGERQRIILARAILNIPKILILDESLSEVNESLEKEILENLGRYLKNSTLIYISHHKIIPNFKIIELD